MTEPQTPPEQPQEQIVEEPQTEAEPLYGAQDVAAALDTSGQRAMAYSYFEQYTTQSAKQGLNKEEADAMVEAIKNGQPWPGEGQINPLAAEEPPPGYVAPVPPPGPESQEQQPEPTPPAPVAEAGGDD